MKFTFLSDTFDTTTLSTSNRTKYSAKEPQPTLPQKGKRDWRSAEATVSRSTPPQHLIHVQRKERQN